MNKESIDDVINPDAMPFIERMAFQLCLIKIMLGEDFKDKPKEERFRAEMEWANKYARKVSEIIDDIKNIEIRELIYNHEYEKAVEFLKPILENEPKTENSQNNALAA